MPLQVDRQPEDDERDDLGQPRQRTGELLDLTLVRRALVAHHDAGDEDGEEARALEAGREPVERRVRERRSAPGTAPRWATAPAASAAGAAIRRRDPRPPRRPSAGRSATGRCRRRPSHRRWRPSRLTMIAMPTGSLAPDSPSSRVPERPVISRLPSTENTTAGSVGARAAPMSRAASHSNPKIVCASTARAAVVTTVPATPSHTTPPSAGRIRSQPMCMPAVEEDQYEGDRDDPLVGHDRAPRRAVARRPRPRRPRSGTAPAPAPAAARPAGSSRPQGRRPLRREGWRGRTGSDRPSASFGVLGVVGTTADQTSRRTVLQPSAVTTPR